MGKADYKKQRPVMDGSLSVSMAFPRVFLSDFGIQPLSTCLPGCDSWGYFSYRVSTM